MVRKNFSESAQVGQFEGKTAIVTGAASGIGAAIATMMAEAGATVYAADRDGDALQHSGPRIINHVCDMTDRVQVEAMIEKVIAECGRIDVLFNNAGTGSLEETPDIQDESWERVFKINVTAVMYACRAAIPHMREAGGGAIVNTASISGLAADYGHTAYNASKGAVIQYTRAMAIDHGRDNIRVNAFCPGLILGTRLTGGISGTKAEAMWNEVIPLGRGGTADEMAPVALFLASDAAAYMTGSVVVADGGLTAHTGQPNMMKLVREMMAQ